MSLLQDLANKADKLELALEEVNNAYQEEASRLAKTVTVLKRKASIVLTSENGQQIVIGKKNTYCEAKIWEYDGKKGKLLADGVRSSIHSIKIMLAEGVYK